MKFILLFGPQAVGKMTVGQELEKLSCWKLFHNHQTIDLVSQYFDFGTPEGQNLVEKLRMDFFRAFAASHQPGFIFTFMWCFDDPSDQQFAEGITQIFEDQGADVFWIELEADFEKRLERNRSANRLEHKPSKRNIEKSEKHLRRFYNEFRLNSVNGEITRRNYLKVNNTNLTANAVAEIIHRFVSQ